MHNLELRWESFSAHTQRGGKRREILIKYLSCMLQNTLSENKKKHFNIYIISPRTARVVCIDVFWQTLCVAQNDRVVFCLKGI